MIRGYFALRPCRCDRPGVYTLRTKRQGPTPALSSGASEKVKRDETLGESGITLSAEGLSRAIRRFLSRGFQEIP
jgi:hypothetical protein